MESQSSRHCRCGPVNAESVHPFGSDTVVLHNVCNMGHGAGRIASRTTVHVVLVVLVVIHRCRARVHDWCKIRRTVRRPARGPAHNI